MKNTTIISLPLCILALSGCETNQPPKGKKFTIERRFIVQPFHMTADALKTKKHESTFIAAGPNRTQTVMELMRIGPTIDSKGNMVGPTKYYVIRQSSKWVLTTLKQDTPVPITEAHEKVTKRQVETEVNASESCLRKTGGVLPQKAALRLPMSKRISITRSARFCQTARFSKRIHRFQINKMMEQRFRRLRIPLTLLSHTTRKNSEPVQRPFI